MSAFIALVFWLAAGLFLISAYPMSPPGLVPGFSANVLANVLFLITTCLLLVQTYALGSSKRDAPRKLRRRRRFAYLWLCLVISLAYLAVLHVLWIGPGYVGITVAFWHLVVLSLLLAVFFMIRYWGMPKGA